MKEFELKKVLSILEEKSPGGIGILSLSNNSGVKPYTLRKFFKNHKDFCVQIPDSQLFTLNKFGKFKGDIAEMAVHYQTELEQRRKTRQHHFYLCSFIFILQAIILFMFFIT